MAHDESDSRPEHPGEALDRLVGEHVAEQIGPAFERLLESRTAKGFFDAERELHRCAAGLADAVVALGLTALAVEPEFEQRERERAHATAKAAGVKMKSCGRKETLVRLLGGTEVRLKALNMLRKTPKDGRRRKKVGKRGPVGSGVYPTLAALGIVGRSTPALRERVARGG